MLVCMGGVPNQWMEFPLRNQAAKSKEDENKTIKEKRKKKTNKTLRKQNWENSR